MFLFCPIHFLKFWGKSQPQRSYKNGSYKRKIVYFNTLLLLIFAGTIFRENCQNTELHKQTVSLRIDTTDFA